MKNNDVISINRQFLIMARETAQLKSGELLTGLPKSTLDRLAGMTIDQIEQVACGAGVSLITLRLTESEINRLLASRSPFYTVAVLAGERR